MPASRPRVRRAALGPPALLLGAALAAGGGRAADDAPSPEGVAFFEKKVRPVLAQQCYACHAGSTQAKGGLRVDTRAGLLVGGTSGPAVVPGKPDDSPLFSRVHDGEMPPKAKLPASAVEDLKAWIAMGAPDPRADEVKAVAKKEYDFEAARKQWAYQPPKAGPVPRPKDAGWAWTDADRFVRAKQEAAGVAPAADADAVTWLRRVSFDLVGLPPTPEQIASVEADGSRANREKIVDAFLASPAFGERWGRHWLDVARYAESTGKERNFVYPQAWRYRDWVIDAFNADKPYDQFLREQVAGDLLPAETPEERDAKVVATGFLAVGPRGINERNREAFYLDIADEQIETVGRAVIGLSVGCARCHDHKFDPVPASDYYALAGIFRSTDTRAGILNRTRNGGQPDKLIALTAPAHKSAADPKLLAEAVAIEKKWDETRQQVQRLRQEATAEALAAAGDPAAGGEATPPATPAKPVRSDALRAKQEELQALVAKLDEINGKVAALTKDSFALGLTDRADPGDIPVRHRGEVDKLGPVAPRGFPTVIRVADPPAIDPKGSGRRELADWLTRPDHPLTGRVFVNRIWAKLFGAGIVPTVDDFGDQGQKPTHSELLDFLTVRFIDHGWSVKAAVRELVLSRTYQLASTDTEAGLAKDEANVTLWRWNRKRLDAESVRDAVLAAGGRLDFARPAGSVVGTLGARELGPNADFSALQTPSRHRSVYLPVLRKALPEPLALFDMADPDLITGRRDATTSPDQALYLLNSPFALEQAGHLADRVLAGPGGSDADRIDRAYRLALGRRPTAAERTRAEKFLAADPDKAAAWAGLAQALFALPEFRYVF